MNKQMMWGLIVVALFIGAFVGYYMEKNKLTNQMMMLQTTMQKQLDDAKMKNDQLMKSQTTGTDTMMKATPEPSGTMMKKEVTPTGAMMQK